MYYIYTYTYVQRVLSIYNRIGFYKTHISLVFQMIMSDEKRKGISWISTKEYLHHWNSKRLESLNERLLNGSFCQTKVKKKSLMHNVKERRKKKKLIYLHESVLGKIFKID